MIKLISELHFRLPGGIFSKPKAPAVPPPPPPVPTAEDPGVVRAREELRQSERRRKGRASTFLTGREQSAGLGSSGAPASGGANVLG